MTGKFRSCFLALSALGILAACSSSREPELLNIRSSTTTPDEFAILPTKPIELPEDLVSLPTPTPGATNRTDPTPEADAVAALGGNPARISAGGVPRRDAGVVNYASRKGRSGSIRADLAAEDLEFRRNNDGRLLERIFNVNVYFKAYRPQSLDQHRELERFRKAGIRTVAAPPDPEN